MERVVVGSHGVVDGFEAFVVEQEPKLRRALVENPTGYLYRVGQSRAQKRRRTAPPSFPAPRSQDPWVDA